MDDIDMDVEIEQKINKETHDELLQFKSLQYETMEKQDVENLIRDIDDDHVFVDQALEEEEDIALEMYVQQVRDNVNEREIELEANRRAIGADLHRLSMERVALREEIIASTARYRNLFFEMDREVEELNDELLQCDAAENILEMEYATNPYLQD